jgi:hypothetical protein
MEISENEDAVLNLESGNSVSQRENEVRPAKRIASLLALFALLAFFAWVFIQGFGKNHVLSIIITPNN